MDNQTTPQQAIPQHTARLIEQLTGASSIGAAERIQSLWSGYGEILRLHLRGCDYSSVIVKHIQLPEKSNHPRGWNTDLSHQRKLKSYQVEVNWYRDYSSKCPPQAPVPQCLGVTQGDNETLILLSDLAAEGFTEIRESINQQELLACLHWLAYFHATYMDTYSEGLWETGTYWHLDTRPDELKALEHSPLKLVATEIDQRLQQCHYQTLVHGDAKLANFCFSKSAPTASLAQVAAVDFQYVGRGCGIKDVAYFLGSCLTGEQCERQAESLLSYYFEQLGHALKAAQPHIDKDALEAEWRSMYKLAWADFERFLRGWNPGHWKLNDYSHQLTQQVIQDLLQRS